MNISNYEYIPNKIHDYSLSIIFLLLTYFEVNQIAYSLAEHLLDKYYILLYIQLVDLVKQVLLNEHTNIYHHIYNYPTYHIQYNQLYIQPITTDFFHFLFRRSNRFCRFRRCNRRRRKRKMFILCTYDISP